MARAVVVIGVARTLVDRGDVEQLVVYFSGHGINTGNSEFWLLSGAPEDGSQAVNVSLTSWYGERLPVRHVVLVSDACRTAASTTQELSIQGTSIVPNLPPSGPAASVDVFYACALGDPAYEVKDPAAAGAAYRALYTTVLVGALRGEYADLVTAGAAPGFGLVQPWPLKRALPGLVAAQLAATQAPLDLNQTPDARLSSDPQLAWLSRLEPWPRADGRVAGAAGAAAGAEAEAGTGAGARARAAAGAGAGAATGSSMPESFGVRYRYPDRPRPRSSCPHRTCRFPANGRPTAQPCPDRHRLTPHPICHSRPVRSPCTPPTGSPRATRSPRPRSRHRRWTPAWKSPSPSPHRSWCTATRC